MGEVRFMISEAAKQVDVESHVLRYWEDELNLTIGRTEMGHRYYTNDDIQLFRCIKKLKDEGMLLRDLKPLIPELKATRLKLKTPVSESAAAESIGTGSGGTKSDAAKSDAIKSDGTKSIGKKAPADSSGLPDTSVNALKTQGAPESGEVMIPLNKAEQVRALFGEVFRDALTENNEVLKKDISSTVTADVMHEIDYLLQAKERQQEEHFRRLDTLIRHQQANRRESARSGPLMKLRKIFT